MALRFLATINVPGYLPDAEPVAFHTAGEAWNYLLDEYVMSWNDVELPGELEDPLPANLADVYRTVCETLRWHADGLGHCVAEWAPRAGRGWGDPTDLGLVYSVELERQ